MNFLKKLQNTIQGIQSKLIDGELEDGTKIRIESYGDQVGVGDLVSVLTDDGEVPAPDGEHTLSNGTTVVVTEGGKITEVKEKEVENMKDEDKPTDVEAALLMLAEGLKAVTTKLAEMEAAKDTPVVEAKRTPAPVARRPMPVADAAIDKTKTTQSGWDIAAKFAQRYGEKNHNLKFN
jgi:hypothetical protein